VQVAGQKKYAIRIEVNPVALVGLGVGIDQVITAVGAANSVAPAGAVNGQNSPRSGSGERRKLSSLETG